MNAPTCPYCDMPMRYVGADDGLGDFGLSVCDTWECWQCEHQEHTNCIDDYEGQDEYDASDDD